MPRVCFQLQVRPDRMAEYVERHRAVWPTMLRAIEDSGRRNYSLFLRDDGLLIGYYETDDDAASAQAPRGGPATPRRGRRRPPASSSPSPAPGPTRAPRT